MDVAFSPGNIKHIRVFLALIHFFRIFYLLYYKLKFIPKIHSEVISATIANNFHTSADFKFQHHKGGVFFKQNLYGSMAISEICFLVFGKELIIHFIIKFMDSRFQSYKCNVKFMPVSHNLILKGCKSNEFN